MALRKPSGYDELPDLVLYHIFQYLSAKDLVSAKLVCDHWLNATKHDDIWKDKVLVIKSSDQRSKIIRIFKYLPQLKHVISQYWFDFSGKVFESLLNNVSDLRSMHILCHPSISASELERLVRKYPNLESITVDFYAPDLMDSLHILKNCIHLKEVRFTLRGNGDNLPRYKTSIIRKLAEFPNLEKINLTYLQRISEKEVLYVLEKKCSQLTCVTAWFDEGMSVEVINSIFKCTKLTKLALEMYRLPRLPLCFHNLNRLKSLRLVLGQILNYENPYVRDLTLPQSLERLEIHLNLFDSQPSRLINKVLTLKNLKFLKVSNLNDEDVNEQLSEICNLSQLETLILYNFQHFSEKGLEHISKCQNLRNLSLLRMEITKPMLKHISHMSQLCKIMLNSCVFTLKDFLPITKSLKYITYLELPGFKGTIQEYYAVCDSSS